MSSVLIVDDSPADRALFRVILGRAGFVVHELAMGREVPAKVREVRPHILVLDVNLPDIDGHAVCRAIRADPELNGVPVLMLTVRGQESDILAGLDAGADDYVPKDADSRIVLARVRRLVRYRQMATTAVLNEQLAQVGKLLAGIVHEIRGPLAVIRGNAELLRMGLPPEGSPLSECIDPILRGAQVLQDRLEHLMASVRSGPSVLTPLAVGPLIREASELFRKGIDYRAGKVQFEILIPDALPAVRVDAGRLMQVVLNLLSNAHEAILADRHEGRIVVRVEAARDLDREWIKVSVTDDGPGIRDVHLGRIFEPFYTTKETGTGYGLYLASEILREHGGRLTATNADPRGACFTIWLPLDGPGDGPDFAIGERPQATTRAS